MLIKSTIVALVGNGKVYAFGCFSQLNYIRCCTQLKVKKEDGNGFAKTKYL